MPPEPPGPPKNNGLCLEKFEGSTGRRTLMAIGVAHVGTGNVGRLALERASGPAMGQDEQGSRPLRPMRASAVGDRS